MLEFAVTGKPQSHHHTPAVVTLSLFIRAQVDSKHVLILRELLPALLSPPSSSLRPSLPSPLPPLLGYRYFILLRSQALDRKWAARDGVYVIRDGCKKLVLKQKRNCTFFTKSILCIYSFLIRTYHGDESCPCPAETPLTPPLLTWWERWPGRKERPPVKYQHKEKKICLCLVHCGGLINSIIKWINDSWNWMFSLAIMDLNNLGLSSD